jgi:Tol biopolymer transport system component
MKKLCLFLVILFFIGCCSCSKTLATPQGVVLRFIDYIEKGDFEGAGKLLKEIGDGEEIAIRELDKFVKECSTKPFRTEQGWGEGFVENKYLQILFSENCKIEIINQNTYEREGIIEILVSYPDSSSLVFVKDFKYLDPKRMYTGIQIAPIFQHYYGVTPLGPYDANDPKLEKPDNWERRRISVEPMKVVEAKITFSLVKGEYQKKWFIDRIKNPYLNSYDGLNKEDFTNFELMEIEITLEPGNKLIIEGGLFEHYVDRNYHSQKRLIYRTYSFYDGDLHDLITLEDSLKGTILSENGKYIVYSVKTDETSDLGIGKNTELYLVIIDENRRINATKSLSMEAFPDFIPNSDLLYYKKIESYDTTESRKIRPNWFHIIYDISNSTYSVIGNTDDAAFRGWSYINKLCFYDGENVRGMYNYETRDTICIFDTTDNIFLASGFKWSPDETSYLCYYYKNESKTTYRYIGYIDSIKCGDYRKISVNPEMDYDFEWSLKGNKVLFRGKGADNYNHLYVYNLENNSTESVYKCDNPDINPCWSPDGSKIAFNVVFSESLSDGLLRFSKEICIINSDGTGFRKLTNNLVYDEHPIWSPDGSKIAFSSNRDGNYEVYIMNADGSNKKRITNTSNLDEKPVIWR